MNAKTANSLRYPEQGSPEFFQRHKMLAKKAIESAVLDNKDECFVQDFDLYIGGDYEEDKIFPYLRELGYRVVAYSCDAGLGIKISWGE